MQKQTKQRIAAAFSAGEHADLLEHVVFGKQKAPEKAAELGLRGARRRCAKIVDHARLRIEFLVLILGKIVGLHAMTESEFRSRASPRPPAT